MKKYRNLIFGRQTHWLWGFALALTLTLVTFFQMLDNARDYARSEFQHKASLVLDEFADQMAFSLENLTELGAYFKATSDVGRHLFHQLARPLLDERSSVVAIKWVPAVTGSDRATFVHSIRQKDMPDFRITQSDAAGQRIVAESRADYFPILYLSPLNGHEAALGFDLGTIPERLAALQQASKTRQMLATGWAPLALDNREQEAVFVINPIFTTATAGRAGRLRGFIVAALQPERILRRLCQARPCLRLMLLDGQANGENRVLYPKGVAAESIKNEPADLRVSRTIKVVNRDWTLVAVPAKSAFTPRLTSSITALVFGLMLSVLVAVLLRLFQRRRATIEREVREKTQALKEERNFNHTILESAGLIIMVIDRAANIIRFNRQAEMFTGFSSAAVMNQPYFWERFLLPEDQATLHQLFEHLMATGVSGQYENYWVSKTGEARMIEWFNSVLCDEAGHAEHLVTIGKDVTEHRANERLIRESEARYRRMIDASPVPKAIANERQEITFLNHAFIELFGYSQGDLGTLQDWWAAATPDPDYRAEIVRQWQINLEKLRQSDLDFEPFEVRVHCKNGLVRTVLASAAEFISATKDQNALASEQLLTLFDITEQKQTEAHVRRLLREQNIILDSALTGIVRLLDDTIVWANRSFEEMLQFGPDELNGHTLRSYLPDLEECQTTLNLFQTSITNSQVFRGLIRLERRDGSTIWCEVSGSGLDELTGESIWTILDVTDRKRAEDEVRELAFFDPLTHLPNRRLLGDRLKQNLLMSARSKEYGALLILDLDRFKTLNDTHGHDMGDLLLRAVAQRLQQQVRQDDTVARIGGDEFVVLLTHLGDEEDVASANAQRVAEKIRTALNQPFFLGEQPLQYTNSSSIGVALFAGQTLSPDELFKQADLAMYQAKSTGRNLVRLFSQKMQAEIQDKLAMENALRDSIERNELVLYYQPQVDQVGRLVGVEALLRWQHPERGLVSPGEFIPLAEETGLILSIGQWVVDTACAQLGRWAEKTSTRSLVVSINVSARQFQQHDFVVSVQTSLERHGVNPNRLKLELTESIIIKDIDLALRQMRALTATGVLLSLDDFGTGYSSLAYLKRLPLTDIKIDQSFVRDITVDSNDVAIVRAILAMSKSLGLKVVAEGVETEAQRVFLMAHDCEFYQGYLFGRPVPVHEIDKLQDEGAILL